MGFLQGIFPGLTRPTDTIYIGGWGFTRSQLTGDDVNSAQNSFIPLPDSAGHDGSLYFPLKVPPRLGHAVLQRELSDLVP